MKDCFFIKKNELRVSFDEKLHKVTEKYAMTEEEAAKYGAYKPGFVEQLYMQREVEAYVDRLWNEEFAECLDLETPRVLH